MALPDQTRADARLALLGQMTSLSLGKATEILVRPLSEAGNQFLDGTGEKMRALLEGFGEREVVGGNGEDLSAGWQGEGLSPKACREFSGQSQMTLSL